MINKKFFLYSAFIIFYSSFAYSNQNDYSDYDKQNVEQISSFPISWSDNLSEIGSDVILSELVEFLI